MKMRCQVIATVLFLWCLAVWTEGAMTLDDGPYFFVQLCIGSQLSTDLSCSSRGTHTIQILDVRLEHTPRHGCNSERSSNSTEIPSTINDSCHREVMQRIHTVCGNKEHCRITQVSLFRVNCVVWFNDLWITYKCHQENNVPQGVTLCSKQTVITQTMCRSGTMITIIRASFGVPAAEECVSPSIPSTLTRVDARSTAKLEVTSYEFVTIGITKTIEGSQNAHIQSNLGVAVGVPVSLLLLVTLVTTLVIVVFVRRRRMAKQSSIAGVDNQRPTAAQAPPTPPNTSTRSSRQEVDHAYVNDHACRTHDVTPAKDVIPDEYLTMAHIPAAGHYEALTGNVSIPDVIYENTHAATYEQLHNPENDGM